MTSSKLRAKPFGEPAVTAKRAHMHPCGLLLGALMAMSPVMVSAETPEDLLARADDVQGEVFSVAGDDDAQYVLVPRLNEVWMVEQGRDLIGRARYFSEQGSFVLAWDNGERMFFEQNEEIAIAFTGERFAMADALEQVLANPSLEATDQLPVGTKLSSGGEVQSLGSERIGSWEIEADEFVITLTDGNVRRFGYTELAALFPKTKEAEQ